MAGPCAGGNAGDADVKPDEEAVASIGDVMIGIASGHSELFGEEIASTLVEQ